jgi:threonine/homoserine/homoserine lactone efflux protein
LSELLLTLTLLAAVSAFQPPQVVTLMLLLPADQGTIKGSAYVLGMTAFRIAQGAILWVLISAFESAIEARGEQFSLVVGTVLVVLGIILLIYALRRGFSAADEDATPASWLELVNTVSPGKAALVGAAMLALDPKDWLITLSVVDLIAEADLSAIASLLLYLFFIVLAQSVLLVPLLYLVVSPGKAQKPLRSIQHWLQRHERTIEIVVAAVFGFYFIYEGLEHLGFLI